MDSLPIIDFSSRDRQATAKELTRAMETVGFVYLENVPGYTKEVEENLHKAASWFYSLPLDEKLRLSPKNWNKDATGVYRGYVPINVAEGHLREQYEMGEILPEDDPDRKSGNPFYEATPWPCEEGAEVSFRQLMTSYYSIMVNAAMDFLRLTAIGLGMDEHVFDGKFLPKSVSSLRIMHYPAYERTDQPTFTCEEHSDSNFVTLLVTFSYPGLEVLREDGTWMSVAPRPGCLVVNIGELLSRMTNGKFKATRHRVRDIGKDRYSVPFFFEPRFDSILQFPGDTSTITYGPWLLHRMKQRTYQYGHLPDFPLNSSSGTE